MEKKEFEFGGDVTVISGPSEVDISNMNFFDDLEYECWNLIKQYAGAFGFEVKNLDEDEDDIDFYAAKSVQDKIIELFEEAGITFITEPKQEEDIEPEIDEGMSMT